MSEAIGSVAPTSAKREVSLALGLGVLLLPMAFIWFLFRARYSARAQILGCLWMGVIGTALLLSAPSGPLKKSRASAQAASQPPTMATKILDAPGSSLLMLTIGETRSIQHLLRTPVMLTNNTGVKLDYAEVLCVFYAADGRPLGKGLRNWVSVEAGRSVSGEVLSLDIDLGQIGHRECQARSLKGDS